MKRKYVCLLQARGKSNGEHIELIDKTSSNIMEGIQLIGGEVLSVSMTCTYQINSFLFMVFYEDHDNNESIKEFLKQFHYAGFLK